MSDTAIISLAGAAVSIVTTIVTFFTLWIKLRYGVEKAEEGIEKTEAVEAKLDDNTKKTEATKATTEAVAYNIDKKLNGGLDAALEARIKPLQDTLEDHVIQDGEFMREVRDALNKLREDIQRKVSK
jgi:hypothetical protein